MAEMDDCISKVVVPKASHLEIIEGGEGCGAELEFLVQTLKNSILHLALVYFLSLRN